jgi:hypothetical protein
MGECGIPPPFLTSTLDEEFLLLTSCGARMTHRQFKLALAWNLIEKAESLPYSN